jgi:hypothetical protein
MVTQYRRLKRNDVHCSAKRRALVASVEAKPVSNPRNSRISQETDGLKLSGYGILFWFYADGLEFLDDGEYE